MILNASSTPFTRTVEEISGLVRNILPFRFYKLIDSSRAILWQRSEQRACILNDSHDETNLKTESEAIR